MPWIIEAITASRAESFLMEELEELNEIRLLLKNPKNAAKNVAALQEENKQLKKEVEKLLSAQAGAMKGELLRKVEPINGLNFLGARLPLEDSNAIKTLAYQLEEQIDNAVIVFGAEVNGKPQLLIAISRELTESKGLHAGNMIRELAREIQGGGGGQPFFATAGGKDSGGLERAIAKAREMVS